ncbi:hypothetical protein AB0E69_35765 [Kribbella sp. NPDC026611]|uniref:hypothetical protein n=1 Tax=Kribbella sp. NPDC026611 TaxID=3154911 RepID=UPI00340F05DA
MSHASPPGKPKRRVTWVAAVWIFILGLLVGAAVHARIEGPAVGAPQPTATVTATVSKPAVTLPAPPRKTVTARPPTPAAAIHGDGTYEVGVDIKAGDYKAAGGAGCYWARLKSLDGGTDAIITNNLSNGPQTVTVKTTDKGFETARCGPWTKVG